MGLGFESLRVYNKRVYHNSALWYTLYLKSLMRAFSVASTWSLWYSRIVWERFPTFPLFVACSRTSIFLYFSSNEKAFFIHMGLYIAFFFVNLLSSIGYMAFENCKSILYARYHSNSKVDSSTLINCSISQEKSHE